MAVAAIAALVVTGSYIARSYPAHRRISDECVICRTEIKTTVKCHIFRRVETNNSTLAMYFERERLVHAHSFWPKVNIAHNVFGQPCRTAYFQRHPIFALTSDSQLHYLTNDLPSEAILGACLALTNVTAATSLRERIEHWEQSALRQRPAD